jgi:hypothetical protein
MLNNFIRKLIVAIALVSSLSAGDYHVEDQSWVVEKAREFDLRGTIQQKDNGYQHHVRKRTNR